ncbi:MAG: histidine kinase dimerization/phosphoacceptor domain -containing protein [Pseudomonadota bacterium]
MSTRPILIVDDEASNLATLKQILGDSYPLVFARSGSECLSAVKKHQPALILLDIQMPDMDGYTVCRLLKADAESENTPVIFISSMREVGDEFAGFECGAVDYIVKPVSPALVHARVRTHLSLVRASASEQHFRVLLNTAPVMMWMTDKANRFELYNEGWLRFTGRTLAQELQQQWENANVHPEDRARQSEVYLHAFQQREQFEHEYRLKNHDEIYRWIKVVAVPRLSANGNFAGFIGCGIDITEQKEREQQISEALKEKETLLREIHHRVKNNLQIIDSLLGLKSGQVDDPAIVAILQDSQNRVKSMALIHQTLYQSNDFARVDFTQVCHALTLNLFASYGVDETRIRLVQNTDSVFLPMHIAIPLGLLLNELVSNALKYAYPADSAGEIRVLLKDLGNGELELSVSDDGPGLPEWACSSDSTLGLQLVQILSEQIDGKLSVHSQLPTTISIVVAMQNGTAKLNQA